MMVGMEVAVVDEAIELLEKANADLEPELLSADGARVLLRAYTRAERLAAFGVAALARKIDDAPNSPGSPGPRSAKPKRR
jgi:hypothetical protein